MNTLPITTAPDTLMGHGITPNITVALMVVLKLKVF
jgi:hypothetical protein